MTRVVVATDGSPGANRAVDAAARLAKEKHCELLIVTVGGSITGAELRELASEYGDLSKTLEQAANKVLSQAHKRALRIGAVPIKVQVGWGDPAETIIETVRRDDILVVGRRGRGPLTGLLLGSVSQKVTSLAPCVVMVVP
jgi:nucleotide-binding universal stress UspA family protein